VGSSKEPAGFVVSARFDVGCTDVHTYQRHLGSYGEVVRDLPCRAQRSGWSALKAGLSRFFEVQPVQHRTPRFCCY
jgi:hypothetical protein